MKSQRMRKKQKRLVKEVVDIKINKPRKYVEPEPVEEQYYEESLIIIYTKKSHIFDDIH